MVVVAHDRAGDLLMWVRMCGSGAHGRGRRPGEGRAWVVGGMCITIVMVVGDGHITCDTLVMCHRLGLSYHIADMAIFASSPVAQLVNCLSLVICSRKSFF